MMLNARQIEEFVTHSDFSKNAQVGIDLSICKITQIQGNSIIAVDKKNTVINDYLEVKTELYCIDKENPEKKSECWYLIPGVYSLTFNENIQLDSKHSAFIIHKSTILRSGSKIISGIFDPGFTSQIGATMFVNLPILIEKNSLVAQVMVFENYEANLYNGTYQGNKDLK